MNVRTHFFVVFASVAAAAGSVSAESVAVKVQTQKGKPIEGAVISVKTEQGPEILATATTNARGVAIVSELADGEWHLEVERPGYMVYSAYVRIRAGKKPELGFASQVSRGDDWEPMRVNFVKASAKLLREAAPVAARRPTVHEPTRVQPPRTTEVVDSRPVERDEPQRVRQTVRVETPSTTAPSTTETPAPAEVPQPQATQPEASQPDKSQPDKTQSVQMAAATQETDTDEVSQDPELETSAPTPDPMAEPSEGQTSEGQASESDSGEVPQRQIPEPQIPEPQISEPQIPEAQVIEPTVEVDSRPEQVPVEQYEETEEVGDETAAAAVVVPSQVFEPEIESVPAPGQETPELEVLDSEPEPLREVDTSPEPSAPTATVAEKPVSEELLPEESATEEAVAMVGEVAGTTTVVRPSFLNNPPRYLRSQAAGNCPECAPGEWAISAVIEAGAAGDTRSTSTCAPETEERALNFAHGLANRPIDGFAGPLLAALWRTPNDDGRAQLADLAAELKPQGGFCQTAGIVLPKGALMTGYSLEAWDDLGGRACSAEGTCAVPRANWSSAPQSIEGRHGTVIYATFRNRSSRHVRNAELTVLFIPPQSWQ